MGDSKVTQRPATARTTRADHGAETARVLDQLATRPTADARPAAEPAARFDGSSPAAAIQTIAALRSLPPAEAIQKANDAGIDCVTINRQLINPVYVRQAQFFQKLVDPSFDPAHADQVQTVPTWFAIAWHPSKAAGSAMGLAHSTHEEAGSAVDIRARSGGLFSGLKDTAKVAKAVCDALVYADLDEARDPRFLLAMTKKAVDLLQSAPGSDPMKAMRMLFTTIENTFAECNQGIAKDLQHAGAMFEKFCADHEAAHGSMPTPETTLSQFSLPGSNEQDARKLFAFAMQHANDDPQPRAHDVILPPAMSNSMNVAGMALFAQARLITNVDQKNNLIRMANAMLLIREQRDCAGTKMEGTRAGNGELDRKGVMGLFTPVLKQSGAGTPWEFANYARANLDHADRNPLTPIATEYNWADLSTRLGGIWDFTDGLSAPGRRDDVWSLLNG